MNFKKKFEEFGYTDILYVFIKIVFFMYLFYYNDHLLNDTRYKNVYETFGLKYYAGSVAISNLITQVYECFCKYFIKSKYDYIVENYQLKINNIPKLQKTINYNIDELKNIKERIKISNWNKEQNIKDFETVTKTIDFYLVLFENNNINKIENINKTISELDVFISNYGESKKQLKNNILKPILQKMNGIHANITPIFLSGNPGTGKTKFVKDLSKILNIPMIFYKETNNRRGYLSSNKGVELEYLSSHSALIYESKKKYNCDFGIIFIDEIDKKLISFRDGKIDVNNQILVNILDSTGNNSKEIYDDYLKIDIDIKNIFIICASNLSLSELCNKDNKLEPLTDRFIEIKIQDISQEIKYNILYDYMKENLNNNLHIDKKFINKLIENVADSGVRKLLKILNKLVIELNSQHIFKDTTTWHDENIEVIKNEIIYNESVKQ